MSAAAPSRTRKAFDPANATNSTPMKLRWLASYLHIGAHKVYDAIHAGYQLQYPRLGMTTPKHFLDWCSQPLPGTAGGAPAPSGAVPSSVSSDTTATRRQSEIDRILADHHSPITITRSGSPRCNGGKSPVDPLAVQPATPPEAPAQPARRQCRRRKVADKSHAQP